MEVAGVDKEYFYSEEVILDDPYDLWLHRIKTTSIIFIKDIYEII